MTYQTLAQKIIARAAGKTQVQAGEIVNCGVDLAMFHDSSGPRRLQPMLEQLGAKKAGDLIWDKNKIVLVIDHYIPERHDESRKIVRIARDWASVAAIPNFYDGQGICHVVVPQHGHIRPGMLCVGGDSHSPTGGAFGAYMFGVGATEMLGVVVTGEIWLRVPKTILMHWSGALGDGVMAKDMMLHMIGRFGMNGARYEALEYAGEAVTALSMQERMTLCNMGAELGAQAALIAPDAVTQQALQRAAQRQGKVFDEAAYEQESQGLFTDPEALLSDAVERHDFDASTLAPQVSAPHSPANTKAVSEFAGTKVDVAYIGACTGAKLADLRAASKVLKGKKIASGVQLMVAPASIQDLQAAQMEGHMAVLEAAGATLLASSCGACAGYGGSVPEGANVISTTARNFKGRMGPASAQVYLASPYTVAAAALAGSIIDPREVLV